MTPARDVVAEALAKLLSRNQKNGQLWFTENEARLLAKQCTHNALAALAAAGLHVCADGEGVLDGARHRLVPFGGPRVNAPPRARPLWTLAPLSVAKRIGEEQ